MPFEPVEPVWELREHDANAADALARSLGVSPVVAGLLGARGITEEADARAFLSPRFDQVPDPRTMAGMDRAADRILAAIDAGEERRERAKQPPEEQRSADPPAEKRAVARIESETAPSPPCVSSAA